MAESDKEAQYKQEFMARVAEARIARGWKQWQAAEALDMPQDKYKQYEGRSMLPHHLIIRFCLVMRCEPEWLLSGNGKRPIKELAAVPREPAPARAKSKRNKAKSAA